MLAELICALTLFLALRHVKYQMLELMQQNAELAKQVLYLTYKVDKLRELSNKLRYQTAVERMTSEAWRFLGQRRPSARMRFALYHRRKGDESGASASSPGEGAGAVIDAMSGEIAAKMFFISSGGIMQSERRLRPRAGACARRGVCGATSSPSAASKSSYCRDSARCLNDGERSCSESGSGSG
jgi:hypothetical protein